MVFALRTNQRAICPRTAQTKKRELTTPSLSHLINLITVFIAFYSNFLLFAFKPQQTFTSIWSEEKEILEKQKSYLICFFLRGFLEKEERRRLYCFLYKFQILESILQKQTAKNCMKNYFLKYPNDIIKKNSYQIQLF